MKVHINKPGDKETIYIEWLDEKGIRYRDRLDIVMLEQNKPRILKIYLNDDELVQLDTDYD